VSVCAGVKLIAWSTRNGVPLSTVLATVCVFGSNPNKSNHEDIKRKFNIGNACCHSVQNLLFSSLLYKNIKIKICITVILPVVLQRCVIVSLLEGQTYDVRKQDAEELKNLFGLKRAM
jgi:hypothetical protein